MRGPERETSIYVAGVSGASPRVTTDASLLEERARGAMTREAFAYVAGGAGTGATMRALMCPPAKSKHGFLFEF